jgi:CBS domain-containing protein
MERHQIKRVPLVEKLGRAVGIISEADAALRVGEVSKTAELATSLCQLS